MELCAILQVYGYTTEEPVKILLKDNHGKRGEVIIENQKIVYAKYQNIKGWEAIQKMLFLHEFAYITQPVKEIPERNINEKIDVVILKCASLKDEGTKNENFLKRGGKMQEKLNEIVEQMKENLPNCLGVGIFSLKEGLIISQDINIPEYDPEFAAAAHADNWNVIKKFIDMLPHDITGKIQSILLELKFGYFQLEVLGNEEYLLMAGIKNEGNIGILRTVIKKFKPKFEEILA